MAAVDTASKKAQDQLKELTECCICAESFTDPKMLPCMHTFCSTCLEDMATSTSKKPGDKMPCPMCRQECLIPLEGFSALPRNFLMDRLVEITTAGLTRSSSGSDCMVCDQCSRRKTTCAESGEAQVEKVLYCVDCAKKLCEKCCRKHRKKQETKDHKPLELGTQMSLDELLLDVSPRVCERHIGKRIKMFCNDCTVVVCSACFVEHHRSHNGSPANKVAENFRSQIDKNLEKISTCLSSNQEMKTHIERERAKFMKKVAHAEQKVLEMTKELKEMIESHSNSLLKQLSTLNSQYLSETQTLLEDIDKHIVKSDGFLRQGNDIKRQGSPVEICKAVRDLNACVSELTKTQRVLFARKPRSLQPMFQGTEFLDVMREKKMKFGIIEENADYVDNPSLMCTVRPSTSVFRGKPVWGVAVLGKEMFLVTDNDRTIEAYDTTTFASTRRWFVDGMNDPKDIRACSRNSCLYVFNWKSISFKEILRLNPESKTIAGKWSTGIDAGRLSVSPDTTVLLSVHNNNKLNEYGSDGRLLHEINLGYIPGCKHPWHAVKLSRDQYVISYGDVGDLTHGVCVIDSLGVMSRSFGGKRGSGLESVDVPMNLGIDSKGSVFVADHNNGRVLVLNSSLKPERVLISKTQGLRKPIRLVLDEQGGRLYIADIDFDYNSRKWQEGEVLVIRIK